MIYRCDAVVPGVILPFSGVSSWGEALFFSSMWSRLRDLSQGAFVRLMQVAVSFRPKVVFVGLVQVAVSFHSEVRE